MPKEAKPKVRAPQLPPDPHPYIPHMPILSPPRTQCSRCFVHSARPPKRARQRPQRALNPRPRAVPSAPSLPTCSSAKTGESESSLKTQMLVSVSVLVIAVRAVFTGCPQARSASFSVPSGKNSTTTRGRLVVEFRFDLPTDTRLSSRMSKWPPRTRHVLRKKRLPCPLRYAPLPHALPLR